MRVAVVGHIEWVEFVRVGSVPLSGQIVHALETWEEPAGGGAVAAVQLARLAGSVGVDDLTRERGRPKRPSRLHPAAKPAGGRDGQLRRRGQVARVIELGLVLPAPDQCIQLDACLLDRP